jgi:hypothetical protein
MKMRKNPVTMTLYTDRFLNDLTTLFQLQMLYSLNWDGNERKYEGVTKSLRTESITKKQ